MGAGPVRDVECIATNDDGWAGARPRRAPTLWGNARRHSSTGHVDAPSDGRSLLYRPGLGRRVDVTGCRADGLALVARPDARQQEPRPGGAEALERDREYP